MTTTNNPLPANLQPEGDICIPLFVPDDPQWLWYVIKCLSFPSARRFWKKDEYTDIQTMRKNWEARVYLPFLERAMKGETCPEVAQGDCVEYSPRAGFITWFPINPHYDSSIPSGYVQPPFFLWENILPSIIPDFIETWAVNALGFTGYENGDVLTALWAFPFFMNWFNEFSGGFPRFTVRVQGQGSVELHLLNVPLGGRCLITVDVELNPLDIINGLLNDGFNMTELNKDVFAAPPELETVHIVEVELPDDIEHTIYVTFLPTVNDSFDFINFGGGLRKVVLCGVIPIEETTMDCIDVLDCIDMGENESIASYNLSNQALAINTHTPLIFGNDVGTEPIGWLVGAWEKQNNNTRFVWKGTETIKVHVSASAQINSAAAGAKWLSIVTASGRLASEHNPTETVSLLSVNTDIMLAPDDWFEIHAFTSGAGNTVATNQPTRMTAHRIDKTGATGAQGNPGIPGQTGATGTVPPQLEYLFFEQIINQTNIFLQDLEEQYTDSPQDIAPNIPAAEPVDAQETALCEALTAWLSLYVEAKKARIRGASFLNQAWDALTSVMADVYTEVVNVIGWNPLQGLFGCFVDNSTALTALSNQDAINQVVCCLNGQMKDVPLLTTTLEGAINACAGSLAGEAGDIACMLQNDLNLQHTLNFYYLYGRALDTGLNVVCPCGSWSYLEYDFTVSNHGFVGTNAVYVAGVGWEGIELDPDADNISQNSMWITKEYAGALPKAVAAGYVIDAIIDCGVSNQFVQYFLNDVQIQHSGIGGLSTVTDSHRTYANSTLVTDGKVLDRFVAGLVGSRCDGQPALTRIKKLRLWLDQDSQLTGIANPDAPLGTHPNGTTDLYWWQ